MTTIAYVTTLFAPSRQAALARIASVRPADYARTRNHLEGAVTWLSPFITHGLATLREVLAGVLAHHGPLPVQHKLVQELGWREFFRHAWGHQGDGILQSLHAGPRPEAAYLRELPTDVTETRTGIPAIDQAVRTLYATGYLHNHARLWLASYLVHLRQVHWRVGADWMVAHLLDGDLASNHLSWQWVAGTGSHKPYLFNAENVARFAPPAWHSPGTVIDQPYATLERMARGEMDVPQAPRGLPASHRPASAILSGAPEHSNLEPDLRGAHAGASAPTLHIAPPQGLQIAPPDDAQAEALRGRPVWLVHPWALRRPPPDVPADAVVIGVYLREYHAHWPWTEMRWRWVDAAMEALTDRRWYVDASTLARLLAGAAAARSVDDPHITRWMQPLVHLDPAPTLFPRIDRPCTSFSQWWTRASRGMRDASELLE